MPYKDKSKNDACKKAYALKNKEKIALRNKQYRLENPEKVRLASKKWRDANREKSAQKSKEWNDANKEKISELKANWRKNNRARYNANAAKRRALKINATPKWLTQEDQKLMEDFFCMAKDLETVFPWKQHVDHIIPLQGENVCGLHVPNNLQILSAFMNQSKSNFYIAGA